MLNMVHFLYSRDLFELNFFNFNWRENIRSGPSNQVIGTGITSSIYAMKWNRKIDDGTTVAEDVAVKLFDLSHAKDRKQNVWSWNHEDRLYT